MQNIRAIFFDVDGVLLDSLKPHLQVCADKSIEYGLDLTIPSEADFRDSIVRKHTRISPMKHFFLAVGFSERDADKANQYYKKCFVNNYPVEKYAGVDAMLSDFRDGGFKLGLVTSNIEKNVSQSLGESMRFFDKSLQFMDDTFTDFTKARALATGARCLGLQPAECLYVGDQWGDWEEAQIAGTRFVGVSYGWGISEDDKDFPVADSVLELVRLISTIAEFRRDVVL